MKNHPNDNIYSILGKLEALKPTPEEKRFALVKEIRESVEDQGSITEGVNSVETKLRKQLAESKLDELSPATLGSYAKKSSADAAKRQGKVTGTNQFHKGSEFAVKAFYGDTIQSRPDRTDPKIAQRQAGVGKAVDRLTKEGAGDLRSSVLSVIQHIYDGASAGEEMVDDVASELGQYFSQVKRSNDQALRKAYQLMRQEGAEAEGDPEYMAQVAQQAIDLLKVSAKELINVVDDLNGGVFEGKQTMSRAAKGYEKYGREGMQALAKAGREGKDLDKVRNKYNKYDESVAEGEVKKIPGGVRHTKTDYPGYPTDDTLDNLDNLKGPGGGVRKGRPLKAQTKNPRRDPNAPKKGRGRPAIAKSGPVSMPSDPFGRVTGRVPKGRKGTVHTVDEAMRLVARSLTEGMNFKRMMDEQQMSLAEMVECMNADLKVFKETGVCSDRLRDMMEVYGHAKRQADEGIEQPQQGGIGDVMSPQDKQAKMARLTPSAPGVMGAVKDIGKGLSDFVRGRPETTHEEFDPLEEELNELARLAGLSTEGNAFTGKLKSTPKGGKFDLDGKEYTDTSTLDEEPNEGNAFGKAVADAKADGVQPGEKVRVGDKQYPVKEAQELVAMLKVAGIDTKQLEEDMEEARNPDLQKLRQHHLAAVLSDRAAKARAQAKAKGYDTRSTRAALDAQDAFGVAASGKDPSKYGFNVSKEKQDIGMKEHSHDIDIVDRGEYDREGETCLECDGAGCSECAFGDDSAVDRAHAHAQGMERESAGMAEGRMSEIDMLYQDWVNSEYAPFDSDSGDENLVIGRAQQFLRGKVNPAEIEDIADIMSNHWHGGRGVMGEEELANAPNEKYDTIDATMRTGDADSTGAHRNFGGPGDNLMQQPPNVPARPVRSVKEAILALESELAAEYESIKKASK